MHTSHFTLRSVPAFPMLLLLTAFLAFSLTACADEGEMADEPAEPETPEMAETQDSPDATQPGTQGDDVRIDVAEEEPYGQYLVDGEGRTLYLFTADTQNESSDCYDDCANAWPPLLSDGEPQAAGDEVDASLLGTIERDDGSMQVTYNGWPLYYFQQDANPGDVEGQDIHSFGGGWYLVSPQGEAIEAEEENGS